MHVSTHATSHRRPRSAGSAWFRRRMVAVSICLAVVAVGCSSTPEAMPDPTQIPTFVVPSVSVSATTAVSDPTNSSETAATTAEPTERPTPTVTTSKRPGPKKTSPLTGGEVHDGPVLAVKIDNTSAGRPQYGLAAADIVYVEQVEAGLTRLIAVYQSEFPTEVGPVRSVRSTDIELLQAYGQPGLVFSGGAGGPMSLLAASPVVNMSQDRLPQYFWRSPAANAPYNLHVDLTQIAHSDEDVTPTKPIGFHFDATDSRVAKAVAVTDISVRMQTETRFSFGGGRYQLMYDGQGYQDAAGTPVVADNVLLQNVVNEPDGTVDSVGSPSYLSHTVGTGTFTLFRDGHALNGTWERPDADSPTKFLDESGKVISFKPGKTWVLLAPQNSTVTLA